MSAKKTHKSGIILELPNHFNDFISFYQTIDVLIIDDIQEFPVRINILMLQYFNFKIV